MKYLLTFLAACSISLAESPKKAGLIYWQAFATLPPIDDTLNETLREWRRLDFTDAVANLDQVSMSMTLLHQAAELADCDWGIGWSARSATLLPHLGKARTLARIACLRGRILMANRRVREAIDGFGPTHRGLRRDRQARTREHRERCHRRALRSSCTLLGRGTGLSRISSGPTATSAEPG